MVITKNRQKRTTSLRPNCEAEVPLKSKADVVSANDSCTLKLSDD